MPPPLKVDEDLVFTHGDAEEEETRHFSSAKRKSGNQTMEFSNKMLSHVFRNHLKIQLVISSKRSGSIFQCSNQFQPVDEKNILPFQLVIEMDFGRQLLKGPVFRRKESSIFFQVLFWYS